MAHTTKKIHFCTNCGKEVNNESNICLNCGVLVKTEISYTEINDYFIVQCILALLIPVVGLIAFVVGLVKKKYKWGSILLGMSALGLALMMLMV